MLVRLEVARFRNFTAAAVDLDARFVVLVGENGAGKTNLLEALYLAAAQRSHRCTNLGALVREGSESARILVHHRTETLPAEVLELRLVRTRTGARRTVRAGGKPLRPRAAYGRVKVVLFSPEDLQVLRGPPSDRRAFLDRAVAAVDPLHLADLSDYDKVLRSRNRLLADAAETGRFDPALIESYDAALSEVGARIWARRRSWVRRIAPALVEAYADVDGGHLPPQVAYASKVLPEAEGADRGTYEAAMRGALAERLPVDRIRGHTTVGPHRDDLVVTLAGHPVAQFASQGQTRALVLALKIAELSVLAAQDTPATLLLDDVSSELDPKRTARFFDVVGERAGQCVLTTTDATLVRLPPGAEVLRHVVRAGSVHPFGPPSAVP